MAALRLVGHELVEESTVAENEAIRPDASAVPPEDKRPFVQRLFTRIAPRYDRFNRLASCGLDQHWRKVAISRGRIQPGQRVLDVCSGTGDLAILCARRRRGPRPASSCHRGGQGVVVGADLNVAMLSHGRRKQRSADVDIDLIQSDAEALPFAGETFDRVLIGFSTRNLAHLDRGLREMLRVLRPHGQLIMLETGYPANPLVRFGYRLFLLTGARAIGFLLTGRLWPFTYLAKSVQRFLTPAELVERLQRLGTAVEYVPLSGGLASLYLATKYGADHP